MVILSIKDQNEEYGKKRQKGRKILAFVYKLNNKVNLKRCKLNNKVNLKDNETNINHFWVKKAFKFNGGKS